MSQEMNPKEKAEHLYIDCYPTQLDNGNVVKKWWGKYYALKIVENIINETMDEYTNDENHDRVMFWNEVKNNIKLI